MADSGVPPPADTEAKALERSLSLLHAALESTADGLLIVDRAGRIAGHNATL